MFMCGTMPRFSFYDRDLCRKVSATLSDKISADQSAENLTYCRKFCPPKHFSAEIVSDYVIGKKTSTRIQRLLDISINLYFQFNLNFSIIRVSNTFQKQDVPKVNQTIFGIIVKLKMPLLYFIQLELKSLYVLYSLYIRHSPFREEFWQLAY